MRNRISDLRIPRSDVLRGIGRSQVRFLMENQNFSSALRSWQDEKILLYFSTELKTYHQQEYFALLYLIIIARIRSFCFIN